MATQADVDRIKRHIMEQRPDEAFAHINPMKSGIKAIAHYLSECSKPVSPGQLSETLNVSSARIAALLRKMEQQDLIIRTTDPTDHRKVCVCLSEHGKEIVTVIQRNTSQALEELIDRMGMEKLETLFTLADELKIHMDEICDPVVGKMERELGLEGDENQ